MQRHNFLLQVLSRRLPAACLVLLSLLLSLPMNAREWYGETINTSDKYYLYVPGSGFLTINANFQQDTPKDVTMWKFSAATGSTNIRSTSNTSYYVWMQPHENNFSHTYVGDVDRDATIKTTNNSFQIKIPSTGEYQFYKTGTVWGSTYYRYLNANGNGIAGQVNANTNWNPVSERQAKAHISVSTNIIEFGGIQYNGDYGVQYFTISYNEPGTLTITKTGCVDAISVASTDSEEENYGNPTYTYTPKDTYGTVTIKVTYRTTTIGKLSDDAKLTISANGAIDKDKEDIKLSGEITPISYKAEWYIDQIINVGDVIEDFVTLPEDVKQAGATIKTVTANPAGLVSITKNEGKWVLTALGVGTVDLRVTADAIGNFASLNELKDPSVTITNLQKQYIRWEQSFKKLLLGGADIALTAIAVDAEGNPTGNPISYTLASNAPGIVKFTDATHTALTILGEGTTEITAIVAETATHVGNSMTLPIVVRDPNKTCDKPTYNASTTLSKSNQTWTYSIPTLPDSITINYYKSGSVTRNIVFFTSKDNGTTWTVVGQLSPDGSSYSASLGIDVTNVKLECPIASTTNKINVTNITITSAQYAKTLVDALDFKTTYNTTISNSVSVDWCNAVLHAEIEQTGTHFTLDEASGSQEAFGNCGEAGTQTIKVKYMPISGGTETAYLHIKDNGGNVYKTITLNGIPDKLPQTITWNTLPASFNTTATIDLSKWGIKASSGLTDFQYAITQGNGTVATLSGPEVTIITSGTLKISITQNGNDIYKSKTEEVTLTIKKVTPTLRAGTTLTTTPIVEGSELQTSTIGGAVYEDDLKSKVEGSLSWDFPTAKPTISGKTNVIFTPTNSAWYESVTINDVPYTILNKPTFTCPSSIDFGTASVIDGGSSTLTFNNLNDQGQTLTWYYEFTGTHATRFAIDGSISNSGCTVKFNPQDATAHSATLTIWATYTAEGLTVESERKEITLSGTGSIPEAGLNYSLSTCDFGDVYGVKKASQEVGLQFVAVSELSNASFSWKKGNSNNIFHFNYTAGGTYDGSVTITAGVSTPVATTTVYEDVLVVKATKTLGGADITAELPVKITLHPRQANTLALNIVGEGQNGIKAKYNTSGVFQYYYIYIDEIDQLLLKNRNNTTTPITITPSARFDTIATLNQDALTLSAVAKARTNHSLTISQTQSEEYEAVSIKKFNFRVIKHTPIISFREGVMEQRTDKDPANGYYYYAWLNNSYSDIIRTTNHEVPIKVECEYAPHNGQYLSFDSENDWTWNLSALKTGDIRLKITQEESATFEKLGSTCAQSINYTNYNRDYVISVIKDPRHVSISNPDSLMWNNTKPGLFGNIFTVSKTNAEFVGGQWNNITKKWTGTAWTNGGNGYGSTTAFVIKDGGSVVFNFTGIPLRCRFTNRYAGNSATGGLFIVEESNDGVSWNTVGQYATHGTRYYDLSGYSRYIRLSYSKGSTEQEWVTVYDMSIDEHMFIRPKQTFVSCVQSAPGGNYNKAELTINCANWGIGGLRMVSGSNPLFEIEYPLLEGRGIDLYEVKTITITYQGKKGTNAMGTFVFKTDTAITGKKADSCVITVQALAAPLTTIVLDNANNTGLQTGTVAGPSTNGTYAYHRGLSNVDLSHCFDAAGNALFDQLYVFGVTNATNGSIITSPYTNSDDSGITAVGTPRINVPTTGTTRNETNEFNATTTCYVYQRGGDGKSYTYSSGESFDAAQKRFDMGSSMNGKKLYFTGYCPFACMGTTPSEEGWMYFTGDNASVDIYLEDCEIMGKYKTASGCGHPDDYAYNKVVLNLGTNYLTGCSSIFVFMGNQNKTFTPNIHLCGTNSLIGQSGSLLSNVVGNAYVKEVETGIKNVGQGSAPISILNRDNSGSVVLTLDDNWPDGSTTNGYLALDATYQNAPCFDLGSGSGSVVINGGQYHLRNSAADNQYTCNTVACYRYYDKELTSTLSVKLFGFGGDHPEGCSMTINSGTFTMFKNMQGENFGKVYYRDQEEFLDLRLPQNTKINGGTFNGINFVLACPAADAQGVKPTNNSGDELCLKDIQTSTAEDGSLVAKLPDEFLWNEKDQKGLYDDVVPSPDATSEDVAGNLLYGGQSLNADEDEYMHFMLPSSYRIAGGATYTWCDAFVSYRINNWATCTPEVSVGAAGTNSGIKNETKVKHGASGSGLIDTTFQMLYLDVDDNIKGRSVQASGAISVQFQGNHGNITNTDDYPIGRHLNIMMNVEADRWMTFVAPFDITDVSVVEVLSEDSIASLSKSEALTKQADAIVTLFYKMSFYIVPAITANERTVGHELKTVLSSSSRDVNHERQQEGLKPHTFGIYSLEHYDGTNLWDANYYLYEIDGEDDTFTTDGTGSDLNIQWTPVAKKASEARKDSSVLMKKGHVYAIQFPYCPMCNDVDTREYYDYWTGKLVIFHGYGPQTVSGSNAQTTIKSTTTAVGTARLTGNYTFKDMSLSAGTAYLHDSSTDLFTLNAATETIKPTQGYMLFTAPENSLQVASFSRAGRVVSYVQDEEVTTDSHVPSIGDRTSMLLYRLDGGFAVEPVRSQHVNIYDMRGQVLFNGYLTEGSHHPFYLSQGLYVLQGEYETLKVLVE